MLWGVMQVALVISYALECIEKYYLYIADEKQPDLYLCLANRVMTLLTEFPINLAQLYFMVYFIRIKMGQRRLTMCEVVTLSLIVTVVLLNTLDSIVFNIV